MIADPGRWRRWREARNSTSHAYNEIKANERASAAAEFAADARSLAAALEANVEH